MMRLWRSVVAAAVPGAIPWVGLVSHALFDAYIRGNCDPKFGCVGDVQISAFVTGVSWCCAVVGHAPACFVFRDVLYRVNTWRLTAAIIALTIGQGTVFALADSHLPGSTLFGMMAAWAGLSAAYALLVLAVLRRWATDKSLKPTTRGSAA